MASPDVPDEVLTRVRHIAWTLPEAEASVDRFAHAFRIRRRVFLHLLAVGGPGGRRVPLAVCRADPDERQALIAIGHPYFAPRSGRDRLGVVLEDGTNWDELAELVTESYRLLAPARLVTLLDSRG